MRLHQAGMVNNQPAECTAGLFWVWQGRGLKVFNFTRHKKKITKSGFALSLIDPENNFVNLYAVQTHFPWKWHLVGSIPITRKVHKCDGLVLLKEYIKAGNFWLSFIIYQSTNWRGTISLIDCFSNFLVTSCYRGSLA